VKVRESAFLKFEYPQVMDLREAIPEALKPIVELTLDGTPVRK
jgi:hypothetical protein